MKKLIKFLLIFTVMLSLFLVGMLAADQTYLKENVVRLHIRANSDSAEDQAEKLAVRDALLHLLEEMMKPIHSASQAKEFLKENLAKLECSLNDFLIKRGTDHYADISFNMEAFNTCEYDGFSIPAGVYDSLIVELGSANGKNLCYVVFPSLCRQDFATAAAATDMNTDLQKTLLGNEGYQVRFFLLECFGKLECFFGNF